MLRPFRFSPQAFAAAATLLAAFLRLYRLDALAPEAWFDEVWFALQARAWLAQPAFVPFFRTEWGGGSALLVYGTALVQWLGLDGISSSRYVSAAFGALSVPLAYACFGELLRASALPQRRWIAAGAAGILAYLLSPVIIGRVGMESTMAPAFALFIIWQFKRAPRLPGGRAALAYVAGGAALGVSQFIGTHGRFLLPLVAVVTLHHLVLGPGPARNRRLAGCGAAALAFMLAAAPLIAFFIAEPEWLLARARITTAGGPLNDLNAFNSNLWFLSISFNFMGSFDPLTNYPGLPLFDAVQSLGWWFGHGWALARFRQSAAARELLAWEFITVLPSLLTSGAPNFQRMVGVTPPASCLAAVGWVLAVRWLGSLAPARPPARQARALGLWLLAVGAVASPLYHVHTLFFRYPLLSILPVSYLHAPVRVARELISRANSGERVFVSRHPEDADVIAFEFLFPGAPVERLDLRQCLPLTANRAARTHYLVLTRRDGTSAPALNEAYPDSVISSAYFWQETGTWFRVAAHTPPPQPPFRAHAAYPPGLTLLGYEWSGEAVQAGQSLFLTLWWQAEADLSVDYTSFLHVGDGAVVAQRDSQPCQGLFPTSRWRTGDLVRDSFAVTVAPDTPPGLYPLAVGWYTYPDLARLPLLSADNALPDGRAIIAHIRITP